MMTGATRWVLLSLLGTLVACSGGDAGSDERVDALDTGPIASNGAARADGTFVSERWRVGFSSEEGDALVNGWAAPEVSPETGASFTWASDLTATVRLRLVGRAPGTLHVRCAPFVYDSSVTQTVVVRINDRELDTLTLEPRMTSYALPVPGDALVEGDNAVTFGFTYAETPQAHGLGDDTRPLAAAFEAVSLSRGSSVRFSSEERDVLVSGWAAPEVSSESGASFTWATDLTAAVRLHLVGRAAGTLHVRCEPFVYDASATQTVAVRINDRELDVLTLEPRMTSYALPVPGDAVVEGANIVTFEFAYAETPQAHGLGDDARRLAGAFELVAFR